MLYSDEWCIIFYIIGIREGAEDMDIKESKAREVQTEKQKSVYRTAWERGIEGAVLFCAAFLLLAAANLREDFAQWYSLHVYSFFVSTVGRFFGIFAFSASEFLLYVLLVFLIWQIIKTAHRVVKEKRPGQPLAAFFSGLFLAAGILFFLYAAFCGVNYHRTSFDQETGLEWEGATVDDLREVCQDLTSAVNWTGSQVKRDENGLMTLTEDVSVHAVRAMEKLAREYTCLEGFYPQPNGLEFSWILSVQKLTGIYSPFTIEANYNTDMAAYNIPFTACHELAHLRGFMQEQEANFIGYLAGIRADSVEFNYSGYMLGWIYCTNTLYDVDPDAYEELRDGLSEEVQADLAANSQFWAKYDSPVAEVSDQINDSYLKANGQEDGVASYGRMVELILTYYKERGYL